MFAGQVGVDINGDVPAGFEDQIRGTYQNIEAILKDTNMNLNNLVKLTTFLTNREICIDRQSPQAGRRSVIGKLKNANGSD
ncbi:MAG: RidA family protein [Rhodospirillales bacterium]|nr:RidA family protein [Rhodospirillales bacterium]